MADKKVPQEPCLICDQNPCDCGSPRSRKRVLADRHRERGETDGPADEAGGTSPTS